MERRRGLLNYSPLGPETKESRSHTMGSQSTTPPLGRRLKKTQGACSVCPSIRQLHVKDGSVDLHGPRSNQCSGSHPLSSAQSTLGPTVHGGDGLPTGPGSAADAPCVVAGPVVDGPFRTPDGQAAHASVAESVGSIQHPNLQMGLLRHIPRAPDQGRTSVNEHNGIHSPGPTGHGGVATSPHL